MNLDVTWSWGGPASPAPGSTAPARRGKSRLCSGPRHLVGRRGPHRTWASRIDAPQTRAPELLSRLRFETSQTAGRCRPGVVVGPSRTWAACRSSRSRGSVFCRHAGSGYQALAVDEEGAGGKHGLPRWLWGEP